MVLRLILVSIVAGLGATPPAEDEVAGWSRTVQTWLDARLAEWSVSLPPNEAVLPPPPPALVDIQAATLDDELLALIGEEVELETPAPNQEPKATADVDLAILDDDLAALVEAETAAAVPPPTADAPTADFIFDAIVDEMVADFFQPGPAAPPIPTPVLDLVASQAEVDELETAFVESESANELTNILTPGPVVMTLPVGEDPFLEYGDDFDLGVVPRSNPLTEAVDPPAPAVEEVPAASQSTSCDPLGEAVRLTRDAACAWMNLLQNPAIVTVPE
jgi:hypothetical protein